LISTGLFADNLDEVADRLDQAFVGFGADQVRNKTAVSEVEFVGQRSQGGSD
jgi:hypothetical protein